MPCPCLIASGRVHSGGHFGSLRLGSTQAGGHTGDIATIPLIPQCVDLVKDRTNYFGFPVLVVAAGGIYDGRGLAASLCLGAAGVWVGTRFIACEEANSSMVHKKRVLAVRSVDTTRTVGFTGRPVRVMRTDYVKHLEANSEEVNRKVASGVIPFEEDVEAGRATVAECVPALMGQCAGAITEIKTAKEIVDEMVTNGGKILRGGALSKL